MVRRYWLFGLGLLAAIVVGLAGQGDRHLSATMRLVPAVVAQAPTVPPAASPAPTTPTISLPQPPAKPPVVSPETTASTPPLPLEGNYQDPAGRFKVGLLKGYSVSPLAGSVLVEAVDGKLAYAVVAQSQPRGSAIGLTPGTDSDRLATVATTVFQRGEGFQPEAPQQAATGDTLINWTGSLTIAGRAQPVVGSILVRPSSKAILLLIVTATEAASGQVQQVVETLAPGLQAL